MSRRNTSSTLEHLQDSSSFQSDEDAREHGRLEVSVTELNQLRQHVAAMRKNMVQKQRHSSAASVASAASIDGHVLEDVDLANGGRHHTAGGLMVDDTATPAEQKRMFRLAIVGNIMFVLGALLYVCVAHADLEWAKEIQGIPLAVLQADDDGTWQAWQRSQFQQAQSNNNNNNRRRHLQRHRHLNMQKDNGDDYVDYNSMEWNDLPPGIQLALMALGHSQRTWDNDMTSSIETLRWSQLSKEQQDAAMVIGYTQEEWDYEEDEEEQLVSGAAQQQAYTVTDAGDDDAAYDDDGRGDDATDDRVYNDDRARGNDDRNVQDDDMVDDRYNDDRVAAQGGNRYDDDNAPEDDRVADDDQQYDDDNGRQDDQYGDDDATAMDDQYGDDDDAAAAGDDQVTPGEVFDYYKGNHDDYFDEEEEESTQAPAATGGNQYTVDGQPITTATADPNAGKQVYPTEPPVASVPDRDRPQVPETVTSPADLMVWSKYPWAELPEEIKQAYEILGYNDELWTNNGTPLTDELYWNELTPAQQEQAHVLGFNQALWDTMQEGQYDLKTGLRPATKGTPSSPARDSAPTPKTNNEVYEDDDQGSSMNDDGVQTESMLVFFTSLCFMLVGVMNWLRERQVFHIWMVQGGVFGILGAIALNFSSYAALMLQTVSVHCFLLQALFMLRLRKTIRPLEGLRRLSCALWIADGLFALGAVLQVIMVYWQHVDEEAYYDLTLARGEVVAAWFWFIAAIIHSVNTMALASRMVTIEEVNLINDSDSVSTVSRTLTIERRHPNGERYTIRPAAIQLRHQQQGGPQHPVVLT